MDTCLQHNGILNIINSAIDWLGKHDSGAINVWRAEDTGEIYVDIEWSDGVSTFKYKELYNKILEKGKITKDDLWECQ